MTHKAHYNVYISSCCKDGGIYMFSLWDKKLKFVRKFNMDRPMYTVFQNDRLYALLREPFKGFKESGLVSFSIDKIDFDINKTDIASTCGEIACHLCVLSDRVYVVNYISGNIVCMPDTVVNHVGKSIVEGRQESAHTHFVTPTPDERYILVTDLGLDKIFTYDLEMNFVSETNAFAGSGPRHLVFSNDGKYLYCANELSSTITVYGYDDGKLTFIDEHTTLPNNYCGISTAAAIRCYNDKIYVSNRGHDSIAIFSFRNNKLEFEKVVLCEGQSPRDFNIADGLIICSNEKSNSITVFDIEDNMRLIQSLEIEAPLCVTINKVEADI